MKPGDHPEFFRFPAPAGRSRESSIVLDALGRFWHEGEKIEHRGMARAFASWIRLHPDDGRFILSNGYDWTYITVEDVPYFVDAVSHRPNGEVMLQLSDGSEEAMDPASLSVGADNAAYARVKAGTYEARFRQEAQNALMPLLEPGPDGAPVIQLGGKQFPIRDRAATA